MSDRTRGSQRDSAGRAAKAGTVAKAGTAAEAGTAAKAGTAANDQEVSSTRGGRRPAIAVESDARVATQRSEIGSGLRQARRRRRWTQRGVARRVGLSRPAVSRIERGVVGMPLEAIARYAAGVERPLTVTLRRDQASETLDAGHLAMQELVLRLARGAGWDRSFELPVRPAEPWRSIDVGLASTLRRRMIACECWNTFGDLGAAARSSTRKLAEMEDRAVATWGAEGKGGLVWIVRATVANRALVARYPAVFRQRFPGSSRRWVAALTRGSEPPDEPGLVWCDVRATRLFAWRRPAEA